MHHTMTAYMEEEVQYFKTENSRRLVTLTPSLFINNVISNRCYLTFAVETGPVNKQQMIIRPTAC